MTLVRNIATLRANECRLAMAGRSILVLRAGPG
jgi:hypothetical protein